MRQFFKLIICMFMLPLSVFAKGSLDIKEVKEKYSLVEGEYKRIKGPVDECIEGRFSVFAGNGSVLSFKAGGGLIARYINVPSVSFNEQGCRVSYTTTKSFNGFTNTERMTCEASPEKTKKKNLNVSYNRVFKAEFKDQKMRYTLSFERLDKKQKSETVCVLELK